MNASILVSSCLVLRADTAAVKRLIPDIRRESE